MQIKRNYVERTAKYVIINYKNKQIGDCVMEINNIDDFLVAVRNEYIRARQPLNSNNTHIKRGRSRTISGVSEDLFAELLCNSLNGKDLCYFVDQPMSGCRHKVYPDVNVARALGDNRFEILYMVDLKMDVGYHRNISDGGPQSQTYVEKAAELLNKLSELRNVAEFGITAKSNVLDSRYAFSLHPHASYDEVIIASKNAGNKKKEEELIHFSNDSETNIWVLSTGDHPNDYADDVNILPLYSDWNMLLEKIKKNIEL